VNWSLLDAGKVGAALIQQCVRLAAQHRRRHQLGQRRDIHNAQRQVIRQHGRVQHDTFTADRPQRPEKKRRLQAFHVVEVIAARRVNDRSAPHTHRINENHHAVNHRRAACGDAIERLLDGRRLPTSSSTSSDQCGDDHCSPQTQPFSAMPMTLYEFAIACRAAAQCRCGAATVRRSVRRNYPHLVYRARPPAQLSTTPRARHKSS
jgi:hypothetical protein